ncbi:MAG TPA: TonB family protein [Lacunisphaera sp.]|nr:TonB family protein [Lacunisphaera sp.]
MPIQSDNSTFHYFGVPRRTRIPWLALFVSVSLHALGILGFNSRPAPQKVVVAKDAPSEILMMPNLDEEEDQKPRELSEDEAITPPSVQVPMLADIPTMIETSAFTQLVDLTPPPALDAAVSNVMSIPVNIQRGRPDTSKIKDLFNLADLDRPPQPIVQTPPVFPYELKAQVTEASVRLGFIVTAQGDVILPYVVNSSHRGFERPAIEAVLKWKFKPGMRGGRKVNTRVEQPINFTVTTD